MKVSLTKLQRLSSEVVAGNDTYAPVPGDAAKQISELFVFCEDGVHTIEIDDFDELKFVVCKAYRKIT